MEKNNEIKQNQSNQAENKKLNDPNKIKGKIEVPDKRERKDGPGGN